MILVTQGCNQVYFTENEDVLEVQGKEIILVRQVDGKQRMFLIGEYESMERACEVLREVVVNLDAGGLIFP